MKRKLNIWGILTAVLAVFTVVMVTPWWQVALYAATGAFAALTALSVVMLIRGRKKGKDA